MGDSSGVGPEIILHSYKKGELPLDLIVVGDLAILERCNQILDYRVSLRRASDVADRAGDCINVLDMALLKVDDLQIGRISAKSGDAAVAYVERAVKLSLQAEVSAVVTLPINKQAARLTRPDFTGHTEHIARMCGTETYTLMLVSERLIATHVSTHVSLKTGLQQVKMPRIMDVIKLTHEALPKLRPTTRIAVAGLNPHAGEQGAFGNEDLEEIRPAVEMARRLGIDASGPIPPDTVFLEAIKGNYDAVVCMYHDQGHIPMKLLDFEGGVNVTLGLPIVRTSVDHGTAFDIAYKGIAFTASLREACNLAIKLTQSR